MEKAIQNFSRHCDNFTSHYQNREISAKQVDIVLRTTGAFVATAVATCVGASLLGLAISPLAFNVGASALCIGVALKVFFAATEKGADVFSRAGNDVSMLKDGVAAEVKVFGTDAKAGAKKGLTAVAGFVKGEGKDVTKRRKSSINRQAAEDRAKIQARSLYGKLCYGIAQALNGK
jgi:hypothetical protein